MYEMYLPCSGGSGNLSWLCFVMSFLDPLARAGPQPWDLSLHLYGLNICSVWTWFSFQSCILFHGLILAPRSEAYHFSYLHVYVLKERNVRKNKTKQKIKWNIIITSFLVYWYRKEGRGLIVEDLDYSDMCNQRSLLRLLWLGW